MTEPIAPVQGESAPPAPRRVLPSRNEENRAVYLLARYLLRIFYALVGRFEARGLRHVPRNGPVLFAPNHASFLDPPLVGICIDRTTWFMAKDELFDLPYLGKLLPYIQAFPIRRGSADRAALRRALALLARGEAVTVFPEGERSRNGRLNLPELGISMVALRSRAVVIPVAIEGSREMLPPGSKRFRFGKLRVTFGPPIDLDDLYGGPENRETLRICADRIMAGIACLLGEPPPERDALPDTAAARDAPVDRREAAADRH